MIARATRAIGRACVVALLFAMAAAAQAEGHARLARSVPADGAKLQRRPNRVSFSFSEPIEASFGAIRVFNATGEEVETGSAFRPEGSGRGLAIALLPNLPDGTYTATFRIISADSHPVSGAVVFSIGTPSAGGGVMVSSLPDRSAGHVTGAAFWADRWLGYAAIALALGAPFFLAWAWWPALADRAGAGEEWLRASAAFNHRFRLLLGAAVGVGALSSLLALPLEAASAAGTSLWDGLRADALAEVLDTRFGTLLVVRTGAWVLLGAILLLVTSGGRMTALRPAELGATGTALNRSASPALIALLMLPIGSLLISPALAGHARTQSPEALLVPMDVIHVAAMSLWLGGLATLVVALPAALRRLQPADRGPLLLGTLSRFSGIALASVIALAVSGTVQAVFQVGSIPALAESGYGRAVIAKVVLLGVSIGLGYANRQRLLPALARAVAAGTDAARVAAWLRRNLRTEIVLIGAVLAVTSVLVTYAPAGDSDESAAAAQAPLSPATAPKPVAGRVDVGDAVLRYTVDPARVGINQVNLFLRRPRVGGPYTKAKEVTVSLLLPARNLGPLKPNLELVSPGHYAATAASFGIAGTWIVRVTVRTSNFDEEAVDIKVPVG